MAQKYKVFFFGNVLVFTDKSEIKRRTTILYKYRDIADLQSFLFNFIKESGEQHVRIMCGNETSWVVEYRPVGSSIWQGTDTVNITNYTIRNLSAQTRYEIRVGSLCDSVPAYRIVDGTTGCGIISVYPYTEDFERYRGSSSYYQYSPSDQLPDCWDIVNSGSFSHANGDNYCPRIYGGTSTSYLPNNSGKALLLLSNNSLLHDSTPAAIT